MSSFHIRRIGRLRAFMAALAVLLAAAPALPGTTPTPRPAGLGAAGPAAPTAQATSEPGPVTGLPVPRFVSMKAAEGYMRRGPSATHRIDWILTRRHVPLRVTGEYGNWRRVEDREGASGWMHYSLLSGNRTAIVEADLLPLRRRPDADAPLRAQIERGVIVHLGDCDGRWCRMEAQGAKGWGEQAALWGIAPGELREE